MQKAVEDGQLFSRRMNDTLSRCGNVFPSEEVINMYIFELTLAISSPVQQFYDTHERSTSMEVAQQAKSEGDDFWARTVLPFRGSKSRATPTRKTWALDMTRSRSESTYGRQIPGHEDAETSLMKGYYAST